VGCGPGKVDLRGGRVGRRGRSGILPLLQLPDEPGHRGLPCKEEIKERIPTPSSIRTVKIEVSDTALSYREWLALQGGTPEGSKERHVDALMLLGRSREQAEAEHDSGVP